MSSSRRRHASRLSILALAAPIVFCGATIGAAQHFEQSGRLCAPAVEMSALAGALAAGGYLEKPGAAVATLTVREDGGRLRIQNVALGIDLSAPFQPENEACATSAKAERLEAAGAIPMAYLRSFVQVVRYRVAHPPTNGADLMDAGTSTMMAAYGPYVLIVPWNKPDVPMVSLSCKGGEYYRVDPRTGAVLPFDGCVEGHTR
ncbi:MAG TPA: hypothetical protein VK760_06560, partial [Candidatus Acidoferrales bacterium]|nr:hypothetical protein [Candidatus Acidoferrales bacterium]